MIKTIKLNAAAKNFIDTRKQKAFVNVLDGETELSTGSYWDGGTRDIFTIINLENGTRSTPPSGQYPMFDGKHVLRRGELMLTTGTFLGKPATPSLTYIAGDESKVSRWLFQDVTASLGV